MRLTEITYGAALAIEGYGPGFFRVGPHVMRGAALVTPWDAGPWGGPDRRAAPWARTGYPPGASGLSRGAGSARDRCGADEFSRRLPDL